MFSSASLRKAARLTAASAVAGVTVAFVLLGGPADAATVAAVVKLGRGF
jgi:hypothetical protein